MPEPRPTAPPPLVVASALTTMEGVGLIIGAVFELADISSGRASLAVAMAGCFGAYGVALVIGGLALRRLVTWPRGLALITQLIMLGLAWGLRHHPVDAIAVGVVGAIALAGIIHPASIEALEGSRGRQDSSDSSD